jgi:hypothetical protein
MSTRRVGVHMLLTALAATVLAGGVGFMVDSPAMASTRHHAVHTRTAAKLTFAPSTAGTLSPPAIPPDGNAYLGAWVQPNGPGPFTGDTRVETELSSLGEFQAELGRPLGMVHVFQNWDQAASNSVLNAISSTGAIPVIDWSCGSATGQNGSTAAIAKGTFDALITTFARQLKAYGKPVFLRWEWEPNLDQLTNASCLHQTGNTLAQDGLNYTHAWQTIYNIFKGSGANAVGANNVSFVWNPGLAGNISTPVLQDFWPGYQFVNWIGIDGYSRIAPQQSGCVPANPTFVQTFATTTSGCVNLYATLSGPLFAGSGGSGNPTLPIMIGETGATNPTGAPNHQRDYLEGSPGSILTAYQTNQFPDIKAVNYYDGTNTQAGSAGTWTLQTQVAPGGTAPSGFAAFRILGASSQFSFLDPG